MATTTSQEQTVDYEHFIDYQLKRAQGRIKSVELGTEFVRLAAAAIVFVTAVVVFDYAFALPSPVRLGLLLVALATASAYFVVRVVVPGVRRLNSFYAARTIEQATPEFQNSLINFLDLRRRPKEIPAGVLAALEERAVNDLSQVQVDEKINQEGLVRASYGLAGAVLVACVAVLLNALLLHRSLADSLGRVLLPTADIQPPTNTQLTNVKPGDDAKLNSIVAHSEVAVSVMAEGKEPAAVTLHWSDDGGKFWHEQKLDQGSSKFDPWRTVLPLVEKPFDYYLTGGDCQTKTFHLNVTQSPAVTDIEVTYDYPAYTGWSRYTSHDGNIDALEGTKVTLVATTNRPARAGQIKFGPTKSSGPTMTLVAGREDQLTTRLDVTKDDTYTIWFETVSGETNPRPATYNIKVRVDMPPTVQVKPGTDLVEPPVPANAIVPIGVTARDDFGIEQVTLHVAQGHDTLNTIELTDGQSAGKEFTGTHRLDLAELRLAAGDEINYWIDVADNHEPTRKHATSPHYRIKIGSPLGAEDRQTELARSAEAEKAAKAAERPGEESPDRTPPNQSDEAGDAGEKGQPSEDMKETPKDERALDVIRRFMEEKERERATEQPREPGDKGGNDSRPGAQPDQGTPKDGSGQEKPDTKDGGEKSKPGDKPDGDKQSGDKSGDDKSGSDKPGEKSGDQQSGDKAGSEKSPDQNSGDKASGDKQTGDKTNGEKRDSGSAGGEKPEPGKSGGDKSQSGKSGDNASGDKPSGEKSSDKTGGDKPSDGDKAGGQKSADKSGSQKPDDKSGDDKAGGDKSGEKSAGDKAGGEKPKAGEKPGSERGAGEKSGDEKPKDGQSAGDKSNDAKSADKASDDSGGKMTGGGATGQKKPGDDPNAPKSGDGNSRDNNSGDKPGEESPSGGKPSGDKQTGDKSAGDKQGGDKAATKPGDDSSGDKPEGGTQAGEKPGNEKPVGDKSGASQPGGEKAGDKTGSDKPGDKPADKGSSGQKSGQNTGDQKASDKSASGDKQSSDSAGGEKPNDGNAGEKSGADKSGDKPGGDQSGEKSGEKPGGQAGSEKQGGKQSGDQNGDAQKGASQKGAGEKGAGEKGGQSKGQGAPSGQGSSPTGGGSNASAGQMDKPQPGAGPGEKKGPTQKNDGPASTPPRSGGSNTDYAREGSDLVLERLSEQLDKGEVDPELLKRLGWTQDELEQFVKEFSGPGKTDGKLPKDAQPKSKKPTEPGKTTLKDQKVSSTKRGSGQTAQDNLGDNLEGNRAKAPPEYEDLVRAYNMSQSKSEKQTSPPAGEKPR